MWIDVLAAERDVMQQVVVNLANCTRHEAAAAARASQSSHHSQIAGIQQLKHALAIICWLIGLPGKRCVYLYLCLEMKSFALPLPCS